MNSWFTALFVFGPIGAAAVLLVAFKLAQSRPGDVIRLVASLTLAAVVAWIVPVVFAIGDLSIRKPPSYDVGLPFVVVYGSIFSAAITLAVLLPLGVWRQARSWWDALACASAAGVGLAVIYGFLGVRSYFWTLERHGEQVAAQQMHQMLPEIAGVTAYGAAAGFVFFLILRICRAREYSGH